MSKKLLDSVYTIKNAIRYLKGNNYIKEDSYSMEALHYIEKSLMPPTAEMTLEQMGFVEERIDNRVLFRRPKMLVDYLEYIEFNLTYKEIDLTNINSIDMMLLESIYAKAKELFE